MCHNISKTFLFHLKCISSSYTLEVHVLLQDLFTYRPEIDTIYVILQKTHKFIITTYKFCCP